jgi:hypothetical protein
MATPCLRTGDLRLNAIGPDVVLVERNITSGTDVFGRSAENGSRTLAVNRCGEQRRVEYGGRVWELPPESATWLHPAEDKPAKPKKARWNGKA